MMKKKNIFAVFAIAAVLAFMPSAFAADGSDDKSDAYVNGDITAPKEVAYQNGLADHSSEFGGHGENRVYGPNPAEGNGIWQQHEIQVPFEVAGVQCTLNESELTYACIFYGIGLESVEIIQHDTVAELSPATVIEPELNGAVLKHEVEEPDAPKSFEQRTLEQLQKMEDEGVELSTTQMQLKLTLESHLKECDFGTEHGKGIQDTVTHLLPANIIELARNTDYSTNVLFGNYKKLDIACEEWDRHKASIFGDEYLKRLEDAQKARDNALARIAYLESLSHDYGPSLSKSDLLEQQGQAENIFCASTLYQNHTKATYGCIDVEVPQNRGGYTDTSTHPLVLQYLQSKETGINVVNPDLTPENYLSPLEKAKSYMKAYPSEDIPLEIIKELSAEQFEKLKQHIEEEQQQKGETP